MKPPHESRISCGVTAPIFETRKGNSKMNRYIIPKESLQTVFGERYNENVAYDIRSVLPNIRWLILSNEKVLQQLVDARIVFLDKGSIIATEYYYFWANIPESEENTP